MIQADDNRSTPVDRSPPAQAGASVAELHDVTKIYLMGTQKVVALGGISISFDRGSFWSIMGPSGSGKSTMLNLLGCVDRPTSGHYLLEGEEVGSLDDDRLSDLRLHNLGFIFQSFNLVAQLTVLENIELPLFYLGWETARSTQHAEALANRVGVGDRLLHRPAQLSGGQQQRVAIARALANAPPILLADEPTGNLDSGTGKQIMTLLAELNEQGRTIIMVTHESEIAAYSTHRLHLRDGLVDQIEGGG